MIGGGRPDLGPASRYIVVLLELPSADLLVLGRGSESPRLLLWLPVVLALPPCLSVTFHRCCVGLVNFIRNYNDLGVAL